MTRITLATALTSRFCCCGSPSQIQAQSDTKIVIKDGGSLLLRPDGLDAGRLEVQPAEVRTGTRKAC